jgi:hypothetical protein
VDEPLHFLHLLVFAERRGLKLLVAFAAAMSALAAPAYSTKEEDTAPQTSIRRSVLSLGLLMFPVSCPASDLFARLTRSLPPV